MPASAYSVFFTTRSTTSEPRDTTSTASNSPAVPAQLGRYPILRDRVPCPAASDMRWISSKPSTRRHWWALALFGVLADGLIHLEPDVAGAGLGGGMVPSGPSSGQSRPTVLGEQMATQLGMNTFCSSPSYS